MGIVAYLRTRPEDRLRTGDRPHKREPKRQARFREPDSGTPSVPQPRNVPRLLVSVAKPTCRDYPACLRPEDPDAIGRRLQELIG